MNYIVFLYTNILTREDRFSFVRARVSLLRNLQPITRSSRFGAIKEVLQSHIFLQISAFRHKLFDFCLPMVREGMYQEGKKKKLLKRQATGSFFWSEERVCAHPGQKVKYMCLNAFRCYI